MCLRLDSNPVECHLNRLTVTTISRSPSPAVLSLHKSSPNCLFIPMQGAFSNRALDPGVRWMAITCIKNGVDRYWRPNAPKSVETTWQNFFGSLISFHITHTHTHTHTSPIAEVEKVAIRTSILQRIEEPVQQVMPTHATLLTFSLLSSSTHSCSPPSLPPPRCLPRWPYWLQELQGSIVLRTGQSYCLSWQRSDHQLSVSTHFQTLSLSLFSFQNVQSSSELMQKCALVTMQHVIKALAGRRLVNLRKVFYEITTNLFVYIVGLWTRHLQNSISQVPLGNTESAVASLEMTHICLKSG